MSRADAYGASRGGVISPNETIMGHRDKPSRPQIPEPGKSNLEEQRRGQDRERRGLRFASGRFFAGLDLPEQNRNKNKPSTPMEGSIMVVRLARESLALASVVGFVWMMCSVVQLVS